MSVAEFAEANHRLLSEAGASDPGKYRIAKVPYARAILEAFTDPRWWKIIIMKPAQVGLTTVMGVLLQYIIEMDAKPILWAFPASDDAMAHSKSVIQPIIDAHPNLATRVSDVKAKSSDNTILHKAFPGGYLKLIGLNSPRGARRITVPFVFADDIDGIEISTVDKEGNRMRLLENRSIRYTGKGRKHVHGSTPTIRGASMVEDEYASSNQGHFYVPCPHCNHWQMLVFGPKSQYAQPTQGRIIGGLSQGYLKFDPDNATWACYVCEKCGKDIDESEKPGMVHKAMHRLDRDFYYGYKFANTTAALPGVIGFHFNELVSLLPGSGWVSIVTQFLDAQRSGEEKLRPFVNTRLAETYATISTESVTAEALRDRQETYFEGEEPKIPEQILGLIVTADPQIDRIEAGLYGFGLGEELWLLKYYRFDGSPEYDDVWNDLHKLIESEFPHELGIGMPVASAMIDMGYKQSRTIDFVMRFPDGRRVYAVKGAKGPGAPVVGRTLQTPTEPQWPYIPVGRTATYRLLYDRIKNGTPGKGKIHWNHNVPHDYFTQLANAECVIEWRAGTKQEVWKPKNKNDREEAIDIKRYALACLRKLDIQYDEAVKNLREAVERKKQEQERPIITGTRIKVATGPPPPRRKDIL